MGRLWPFAALPLLVFGMVLFGKGFFLTRIQLAERSSCRESPLPVPPPEGNNCWLPGEPKYDKVVLIVIDAWRYNFARWRERPKDDDDDGDDDEDEQWANNMPFVNALARGPHALLREFESDPPTTTMQRLKGLMTGGLPTFVDVGSSFSSATVSEDNLVAQIAAQGGRVVFMGDDTWQSLFAAHLNRSYAFPSFNVRDLHTVDNGVLAHLYDELEQRQFKMLVAHFLGVDHVGHRFGPQHPEMAAKLKQMDTVLSQVTPLIQNDTLLVVVGDHGMTFEGDHGGASHEELSAALLAYSPAASFQDTEDGSAIAQINLAPTLSLLLGVPIPFGNIGSVVEQFFPTAQRKIALQVNAWQVHRYLEAYSHKSAVVGSEDLNHLESLIANGHFSDFLAYTSSVCRAAWTTFDTLLMTAGIVLVVSVFCRQGMYLIFKRASTSTNAFFGAVLGAALTVAISWNHKSLLILAFSGALSGALLFDCFAGAVTLVVLPRLAFNIALAALHWASLFSNSFIEAEPQVLSFLLVTLLCSRSKKALMSVFLVRLMTLVSVSGRLEGIELVPIVLRGVIPLFILSGRKPVAIITSFVITYYWTIDSGVWPPRLAYLLILLCLSIEGVVLGLSLLLCLLCGPLSPFVIAAMYFVLNQSRDDAVALAMLGRLAFYSTGHRCDFASLKFESAFIGFSTMILPVAATLTAWNALGAFFTVIAAARDPQMVSWILMGDAVATTVFVFVARRHLMVWRIFAPKFVFDAGIAIAAQACSQLSSMALTWRTKAREVKDTR